MAHGYRTKDYWESKTQNKEKAVKHTEEMHDRYSHEIERSVNKSVVYGYPDKMPDNKMLKGHPKFKFENCDSVTSIFNHAGEKTAVLNFASYKNPGGKFIEGSSAQEESLCHESFLYNVLKEMGPYYAYNREHKNKGLYKNRGIYTPSIVFERNATSDFVQCDVITVAAPNKGAAQKYMSVSDAENLSALHARIEFIRRIAEENNVQTLILGAYGCGVFKQEPKEVANAIKEIFKESAIENIVLAIPGNNENVSGFKEVFGF